MPGPTGTTRAAVDSEEFAIGSRRPSRRSVLSHPVDDVLRSPLVTRHRPSPSEPACRWEPHPTRLQTDSGDSFRYSIDNEIATLNAGDTTDIQPMPGSQSPEIVRLDWGRVHTERGEFRDAKLWPGGGRGWDWNETGTHHAPGVQPADVEELVDNGSEVVIIGRGQHDRLQVTTEALELIGARGAEVIVLNSSAAVDRYNHLASRGVAVGALIHSTC